MKTQGPENVLDCLKRFGGWILQLEDLRLSALGARGLAARFAASHFECEVGFEDGFGLSDAFTIAKKCAM